MVNQKKKDSIRRIVTAIIIIVAILIFGLSMLKENYDPVLFITACMASITANIIYEAYVRDMVFSTE